MLFSGDFDVPSSREDVDKDSAWNQWLRNEIPTLFIEAYEAFKVCTGADDAFGLLIEILE